MQTITTVGRQRLSDRMFDFKHKGGRDDCLIGMYRGILHNFCEPLLRDRRRAILGVPPPSGQI